MYIIIADDLTGATDTGIQFEKRGIPTTVLVDPPERPLFRQASDTALSVNASTRELGSQDATQHTQSVCKQLGIQSSDILFKKVDSLMRGNPPEELEAVMKAAGRQIALVAPSFPAMDRTVENGMLKLPDGTKKDLLAMFVCRCSASIRHIPLHDLRTMGQRLATSLSQESDPVICLFDAVTEQDLSLVAEIGQSLVSSPVYCGSAALAAAIPITPSVHLSSSRPMAQRILVVTGSRKQETAQQVQQLEEICGIHTVRMNPAQLLEGSDPVEIHKAAKALTIFLQTESGAILTFDSLFCSQTGFGDDRLTDRQLGRQLADKLGQVLELLDPSLYDGLILVGGDTAVAVCSSLQATKIRLLEEVQCGTPAGLIGDGPSTGLPIVTKSGAFGDENTLLRAWNYLRREGT